MNRELYHHGILGQRWGVRRFQNKDGTLTTAGKSRYKNSKDKNTDEENGTKKRGLSNRQKTALKVGAAAIGVGLAAYGGYRLNEYVNSNNRAYHLAKHYVDQKRFERQTKPITDLDPSTLRIFGEDEHGREVAIRERDKLNQFRKDFPRTIVKEADAEPFKTKINNTKFIRSNTKLYKSPRNGTYYESDLGGNKRQITRDEHDRIANKNRIKEREKYDFFREVGDSYSRKKKWR